MERNSEEVERTEYCCIGHALATAGRSLRSDSKYLHRIERPRYIVQRIGSRPRFELKRACELQCHIPAKAIRSASTGSTVQTHGRAVRWQLHLALEIANAPLCPRLFLASHLCKARESPSNQLPVQQSPTAECAHLS